MLRILITLVISFWFIPFFGQTAKDLEKTNKATIKRLESANKDLNVTIRIESDGFWYFLLQHSQKIYGSVFVKYGIANQAGKIIIPIEYTTIEYIAGEKPNKAIQNDISQGSYHRYDFTHETEPVFYCKENDKTNIIDKNGSIVLRDIKSYVKIPGFIIASKDGKVNPPYKSFSITGANGIGLFTSDGKQILPYEYDVIELGAWVHEKFLSDTQLREEYELQYHQCIYTKIVDGVRLKGALMIDNSLNPTPCSFNRIKVVKNSNQLCWNVAHKATDSYEEYVENKDYSTSYRDDGEKYYNCNDYDKVIDFYSHEGINAPWAKFFSASSLFFKGIAPIGTCRAVISLLNKDCDFTEEAAIDLDLAKQCLKAAYDLFVEYRKSPNTESRFLAKCYDSQIAGHIETIENLQVEYAEALANFEKRQSIKLQKAQQEAQERAIRAQEEKIQQQRRIIALFMGVISKALLPKASPTPSSSSNSYIYNGASDLNNSMKQSGSSSNNASKIAEWEARKRNAEQMLISYRQRLVREPNNAATKQMIRSQEEVLRTCNEQLARLR